MNSLFTCRHAYHVCLVSPGILWDWSYRWLWAWHWVLGLEPQSSVRATSAFNGSANSLGPQPCLQREKENSAFKHDDWWDGSITRSIRATPELSGFRPLVESNVLHSRIFISFSFSDLKMKEKVQPVPGKQGPKDALVPKWPTSFQDMLPVNSAFRTRLGCSWSIDTVLLIGLTKDSGFVFISSVKSEHRQSIAYL